MVSIILNVVKLKSVSLKLRARQGCLLSPPWFKTVLDILARAIRQEKKKGSKLENNYNLFAETY